MIFGEGKSCYCDSTSTNTSIPAYFEVNSKQCAIIDSDIIFRQAVDGDVCLLKTHAAMAYVEPGESIYQLALSTDVGMKLIKRLVQGK